MEYNPGHGPMILSLGQISVFFFILARIIGVMLQAPIFNFRSVPFLAKNSLAIWLAIVLWFVVPINPDLPESILLFITSLIFEVAIGFTIGFLANVIFIAIQSGGEIIDMQMGLSVATALDPVFGATISVVGRLAFYTGMLIFLLANGHHLILSAIHQSFSLLPAGKMANLAAPGVTELMIQVGSTLWLTAIKIAIPAVLLIFISDFTFGIVSRVAPQVNVFMLGFQVKPLLGMFGLSLALPFIIKYIQYLIEFMASQMLLLLNIVK